MTTFFGYKCSFAKLIMNTKLRLQTVIHFIVDKNNISDTALHSDVICFPLHIFNYTLREKRCVKLLYDETVLREIIKFEFIFT
jgi:hypothetical protein